MLLTAGQEATGELAAEILRCEGWPWFDELAIEDFSGPAPETRVLIVVGAQVSAAAARQLRAAVESGVSLLALTPIPALAAVFGVVAGRTVTDAQLTVVELPDWEHGEVSLCCPGEVSRGLAGGEVVAALDDADGAGAGAGLVRLGFAQSNVWLWGYDLCRTVAELRHGSETFDPPASCAGRWRGPRMVYSFFELMDRLPGDVPVADVHQDILRSVLRQALPWPRLWHFPAAAPAVFMVRGDGCGELGVDREIEVVERHGAALTFCRPEVSQFSGDLVRAWRARGHGISIEADVCEITMPADRPARTAAEINLSCLGRIREKLARHRDRFHAETGLAMETFITHSAQWTGTPMASLVSELGWQTVTGLQSYDPRRAPGQQRGAYGVPTALPMRYFDSTSGVQSLWHLPFQWLDMPWQLAAKQASAGGNLDTAALRLLLGAAPAAFAGQLARQVELAAARWHGVHVCSFHPCYVSRQWSYVGSSQATLETALASAAAVGCRFDNLEDFSAFTRARDCVRLVAWHYGDGVLTLTLSATLPVTGLTLLLPAAVTAARDGAGRFLGVSSTMLEGRTQRFVILDLAVGETVVQFEA